MNFNIANKRIYNLLKNKDLISTENISYLEDKSVGIKLIDVIKNILEYSRNNFENYLIWGNIEISLELYFKKLKMNKIRFVIFIDGLIHDSIKNKFENHYDNFIKNFWSTYYFKYFLLKNKNKIKYFNGDAKLFIKFTTVFYKFLEQKFLDEFIEFFSLNNIEYYICPSDSKLQLIYNYENNYIDCIFGGIELLVFNDIIDNFIVKIDFLINKFEYIEEKKVRDTFKYEDKKELSNHFLKIFYIILENKLFSKNYDLNLVEYDKLKNDNNIYFKLNSIKFYDHKEFTKFFFNFKSNKKYLNNYNYNEEDFLKFCNIATEGLILSKECELKYFKDNIKLDKKTHDKLITKYILSFNNIINIRDFEFIVKNDKVLNFNFNKPIATSKQYYYLLEEFLFPKLMQSFRKLVFKLNSLYKVKKLEIKKKYKKDKIDTYFLYNKFYNKDLENSNNFNFYKKNNFDYMDIPLDLENNIIKNVKEIIVKKKSYVKFKLDNCNQINLPEKDIIANLFFNLLNNYGLFDFINNEAEPILLDYFNSTDINQNTFFSFIISYILLINNILLLEDKLSCINNLYEVNFDFYKNNNLNLLLNNKIDDDKKDIDNQKKLKIENNYITNNFEKLDYNYLQYKSDIVFRTLIQNEGNPNIMLNKNYNDPSIRILSRLFMFTTIYYKDIRYIGVDFENMQFLECLELTKKNIKLIFQSYLIGLFEKKVNYNDLNFYINITKKLGIFKFNIHMANTIKVLLSVMLIKTQNGYNSMKTETIINYEMSIENILKNCDEVMYLINIYKNIFNKIKSNKILELKNTILNAEILLKKFIKFIN